MSDTTFHSGNSIPAPGFREGGRYYDDEILKSTVGLTQGGVTLKPGQGVLKAGTLLVVPTSGDRRAVKATSGTVDQAVGILRKTTDTGTATGADAQVYQMNHIRAGIVDLAKVKDANSGVTIATGVLGGYANESTNEFRF